jgi:hypothetical protein
MSVQDWFQFAFQNGQVLFVLVYRMISERTRELSTYLVVHGKGIREFISLTPG